MQGEPLLAALPEGSQKNLLFEPAFGLLPSLSVMGSFKPGDPEANFRPHQYKSRFTLQTRQCQSDMDDAIIVAIERRTRRSSSRNIGMNCSNTFEQLQRLFGVN